MSRPHVVCDGGFPRCLLNVPNVVGGVVAGCGCTVVDGGWSAVSVAAVVHCYCTVRIRCRRVCNTVLFRWVAGVMRGVNVLCSIFSAVISFSFRDRARLSN